MRRVPFDIQFLAESILSEDPDTMSIRQSDVEMLNNKGADVKYGHYSWDQTIGAVPFFIDAENGVVIFSRLNTHGRMERALRKTSLISIDPIMFKHDCVEKTYLNCAGIYVKSVDIPIAIYFYGISQNNIEGIREYLKDNRDKLKALEIRGYSEDANELCGRMWVNNNAISFWNKKDKIKPIFNLVFKFMKNCGLDPAKCAYEFIDSKNIYGYGELETDVAEKDKLSPEEMHAKLEKQHLNKSKKDYGPEFWEKHKKKAARGFDFPAKADASMPALEGIIKLKDLIKEDPDTVYDAVGEDSEYGVDKLAHWFDDDAWAFYAGDGFSAVIKGGNHRKIIDAMLEAYSELEFNISDEKIESIFSEHNVDLHNPANLRTAFKSGPLGEYMKKNGGKRPDADEYRFLKGVVAGRVWTEKHIVSFWNDEDDVRENWDYIKQMFVSNRIFGHLDDYNVDWYERGDSSYDPLTPASSVSSKKSTSDKPSNSSAPIQTDFLEKLFASPEKLQNLTPNQKKKVSDAIHLLPAEKKREALLAMGYKNIKTIEIADALGMTVAQFNHIMNVNEVKK